MNHPGDDLHYRLFAKLLMFLTLLLGGGLGYFVGVQIGQENALELFQKGRLTEESTVVSTKSSAKTQSSVQADLLLCYQTALGATRYAQWDAGTGLTKDEVLKVLPCEKSL